VLCPVYGEPVTGFRCARMRGGQSEYTRAWGRIAQLRMLLPNYTNRQVVLSNLIGIIVSDS
jgi:hypothetical protein